MTDNLASETHLARLELENFRLFDRFALDFHPRLTVLVAPNGGGKTAVLDAVAVALRYFVDKARGAAASHGFDASDIRLVRGDSGGMAEAGAVRLSARGTIAGQKTSWRRELATPGGKTTYVEAKELEVRAVELRSALATYSKHGPGHAPPMLPVVAYYGTGRLWRGLKTTEFKKLSAENLAMNTGGYLDCLEPSSSFGQFSVWFERVVREAQDEATTGVSSEHNPTVRLDAVRKAIDLVLQPARWSNLGWSFVTAEMMMVHETQGRLPFRQLSDGVRAMVSLVGDLAHRCVRLNPHFGADACIQTHGIVLIDEVDMHLHPEWQQLVIDALQRAFPQVQFIVTTHSPQVLSTVKRDSIRVLDPDSQTAHIPSEETRGVEAASTLAMVMGVHPTPGVEEAHWVTEYEALIEQGRSDSPDALALREKIRGHFGPHHPTMLNCDRLIRWQAAKLRVAEPSRPS
jgi:predicted ATP-binding protein involved in virulence